MTRVYLQDTELTGGAGSNISIEDLRKHLAPYTDGDTEYLLSGYQDGYTYQYIFWAGPKKEFIRLPPGALFEYLPDDKTDPNFGKCFLNMGHGLVDVTGLLSVSWNDIIDKPDFDSYQTADQVNQAISDAIADIDIPTLPALADVATSGSYNDLSDTPAIPTVPTNVSSFANDSGYQTANQVSDAINAKVSSVYTVKGSVDTFDDLPAEHEVGDVYNIVDTGMNYVWDGSNWDALGSTVDLSGYTQKSELHKVATSGSYLDLNNKPYIRIVDVAEYEREAQIILEEQTTDDNEVGLVFTENDITLLNEGKIVAGEIILSIASKNKWLTTHLPTMDTIYIVHGALTALKDQVDFMADVIPSTLKRVDLTESEYAALETKDHDTVYVIEADEEMVDITITFNFVDSEEPYPNIEIDLYNEDDFQSIEEGSKIPIYQTTSNDYANDITGTWPKYESGKEIAYQIYARTPPGYRELTIDKFADGSTISFTITANKLGELPAW